MIQQVLVGTGDSLAGHTVRRSSKGTCIGKNIDQGGLEWSDELDRGRKKDVNDTTSNLSLSL